MADHHSEVPLEPGNAKVVIYYLSHDGVDQKGDDKYKLISMYWMEGDDHFTSQVGDDPPEYIGVNDSDNIYTSATHMAGWLDQWRDLNE